jgi:choline dehydrogenase-like flavoprotein
MVQAALTIGAERMRQEKLLGFSVTLSEYELAGAESIQYLKGKIGSGEFPKNTLWHLKRIFGDAGELTRDAYRSITGSEDPKSGTFQLHIRAEQSPNPESRVVLSTERDALAQPKGKLVWRLSAIDKHSMRRSQEIIAQALGEGGFGRLKIELDPRDDVWPPALSGGSHHMGTTRMHVDKRQGVVDGDCRVHGISNLSVAGSSVFPTVGFSNPTLTIVAMTLRLADHLKVVLKRR